MQTFNVLTIQRISADGSRKDRGGRSGDPADRRRRLVRRRIPRDLAGLQRVALPGAGRHGQRQPATSAIACWQRRRSSSAAGRSRSICAPGRRRLKWFHQRPAGASNLLKGDLWGSDVTVTTSRGFGQHAGDGGIRGGRHSALRQGPSSRRHRSRRGRVRSPRLPAAAAGRARPSASSAPAASGSRSAGSAPRSACGWSARGAIRGRTKPCRRDFPSSAAPTISTASCRTATSW